jgi:hypothetical protein
MNRPLTAIIVFVGIAIVIQGYIHGGPHVLTAFAAHKGLMLRGHAIWEYPATIYDGLK